MYAVIQAITRKSERNQLNEIINNDFENHRVKTITTQDCMSDTGPSMVQVGF
jgi:hypothetical protein